MVGTQRPKSTPASEDVAGSVVPVEAAAVVDVAAAEVVVVVDETTTVQRVVGGGGGVGETHSASAAVVAAAAATVVEDSAGGAAPPDVDPGAAPTFPARSLVVKFENPALTNTSATLSPVASNGVTRDCAESWLARVEPPTAGSMRGKIPRKTAVVGRVGSLQMVGMFWTKGLKFCSAATKS
jgi:hypothetical protein